MIQNNLINSNQTRRIRKNSLRILISNVGFYFLSYILLIGIDVDKPFSLLPKVEKYWLYLIIMIVLITIIISAFIRKAKTYWYFFSITGSLSISIMAAMFALKTMIIAIGEDAIFLLLVVAIVSFSVFISQTKVDGNKLKLAEKYNQRSGLLDLKNGIFDLSKQVLWDTPVNEEKLKQKAERLNKLSYIAPAIGFYIARNTSGDTTISFIGMYFITMTIIMAFGGSRPYSMAAYLAEKEKALNKNIVFSND